MKFTDRHKRDIEEFKKLLPFLHQSIHKVQLTNKPKIYHFKKSDFIMRLNGDIIEMSLANEAPIFPAPLSNIPSTNNSSPKQVISIDKAKQQCISLDFKERTEKFGNCVLELTK